MLRRVISLVTLTKLPACSYKPSSSISTGYSADKVSLDKNGKSFFDNLYNLDPGFVVYNEIALCYICIQVLYTALRLSQPVPVSSVGTQQ